MMRAPTAGLTSLLVLGHLALAAQADSQTLRLEGDTDGEEGETFGFGAFVENPAGESLTFTWNFGDDSSPVTGRELSSFSHRYVDEDSYTVVVRAHGSGGLRASAEMTVTVENADPEITHLPADARQVAGAPIQLWGEARDPGDDELMYTWSFGDGSEATRGQDLRQVTHTYTRPGFYVATLTVEDGDGGIARRSLEVQVEPAFHARVYDEGGPPPRMRLEGRVSPAPATLQGGVGMMKIQESGRRECGIVLGLWDDSQNSFLVLEWLATEIWEREAYPFIDAGKPPWGTGERPYSVAGQPVAVAALGLNFPDEWYEYHQTLLDQGGADGDPVSTLLEGFVGGIGDFVERGLESLNPFSSGGPEEESDPEPGYMSEDGTLRIESFRGNRIEGSYRVRMVSADDERPVSRFVEGDFTWILRPETRRRLAYCGQRPFTVQHHTPGIEQRHVDFEDPIITVTFTEPYDPATLNDRTLRMGYLDEEGNFQRVDGELSFANDDRTVRFTPNERLMHGVYHHVRIRGGQGGVKSLTGRPLPEDYRWRFATAVDLVPPSEEGPDEPRSPGRAARGPSAGASGPQAPRSLTGEARADTLNVACHIFQVARDAKLVPGKPALVRVYATWPRRDNVLAREQVGRIDAKVDLRIPGSGRSSSMTKTFKRKGLYTADEKKHAEHTANFYGWTPDPADGGVVEATVGVESEATGSSFEFRGSCDALYWDRSPRLTFDYYLLKVGRWSDGVPDAELQQVRATARKGAVYATQNFPVVAIRENFKGPILIGEPAMTTRTEGSEGELVYVNPFTGDPFVDGAGPGDRTIVAHDYFMRKLHRELSDNTTADLLAGFMPRDIHEGAKGMWYGGLEQPRTVGFFMPEGSQIRPALVESVAHEFGHAFLNDPYHLTVCNEQSIQECINSGVSDPVEGFRLAPGGRSGANKSRSEGNEEADRTPGVVLSLMLSGGVSPKLKFIRNDQYDLLFEEIGELAARGDDSRRVAPKLARGGRSAGLPLSSAAGPAVDASRATVARGGPLGSDLRASGSGRRPVETVEVSGVIAANAGKAAFLPLRFRTGTPEPVAGGPYTLELLGEDGKVLDRAHFSPLPEDPYHPAPDGGPEFFRVAAPAPGELAGVRVSRGAAVLGELWRTPNAPELSFTFPKPGDRWSGTRRVEWRGRDADGDRLFYTLRYSPTGDAPWTVLALDVEAASLELNTSRLDPGPDPTLELGATDGFDQTTTRVSFTLDRELPVRPGWPLPGDTADTAVEPMALVGSEVSEDQIGDDTFVLLNDSGRRVPAKVRYDIERRSVILSPAAPLRPGASYTAVFRAGVTDRFGHSLTRDMSWTFRTAADRNPPRVEQRVPRPGALAVYTDASLAVTLTEQPALSSIDASVFELRDPSGAVVEGRVGFDRESRTVTFHPSEPLRLKTTYRVVLRPGIEDESGNRMAESTSWSFTTVGKVRPRRD